jgi:ATP:ADP antiporter, AAA family
VSQSPGARRVELVRALCLCAFAAVLMAGYAVARPATESLFLEEHGAERLPLAWMAVAAATVGAVLLYSRLLGRVSLATSFGVACVVAGAQLTGILLARAAGVPGAAFVLYVWKDVYIVVLVEIFWTFANAAFSFARARWLYGLFCACGNVGGIAGNLGVGALAARFGTDTVLWLVLPLLATAGLIGALLARLADIKAPPSAAKPSFAESVGVVRASRYLGLLVVLVALVQVVITLVDYQYHVILAQTFADVNERTAIIGRIYAVIDGAAIALQLSTGLILTLLGLPLTLRAVPLALGLGLGAFLLAPGFVLGAVVKVLSKALDYSVFRAAKELLYLPLSFEEKTKGKAAVDMLTYRVAKAGASVLLLAMIAAGLSSLAPAALAALLVAAWFWVTHEVVRRYKGPVAPLRSLPRKDS